MGFLSPIVMEGLSLLGTLFLVAAGTVALAAVLPFAAGKPAGSKSVICAHGLLGT